MSDPNPKKKLFQVYHISEALEAALDMLESNPELPMADLSVLLEALTTDFNGKVEEIGLAVRNIQARIAAKEAEIIRLKESVDMEDAQVGRLKESLMALMNKAQVQKVKGKLVTVSICQNGGALPITIDVEAEDLPMEFRRETVTYSLDRQAVEQAQAVGLDLPNCIIIQPRGSHVRIS